MHTGCIRILIPCHEELAICPLFNRLVRVQKKQPDDTADKIIHVTETPGLGPIAEDTQWFPLECLDNKIRHDTSVVRTHVWSKCVENAHDPGIDCMIAVIGHRKSFCKTLGL